MRLVVDDHNTYDMKRLNDFERILNLFAELNRDFPYSSIIQIMYKDDKIIVSASNITQVTSNVLFEKHVTTIWNLCFNTQEIMFDYGDGFSAVRQIANGC